MPMFFISYKRTDLDFASKVKDFIEKKSNYLGWIDKSEINPGDDWKQAIDTAINESIGLIVIISPESIMSPYVTYEWSYAMGMGKRVIPLVLKQPNDDQEPIHAKIQALHMLFFDNHDESQHEWADLESELENVTERFDIPPAVQYMREQMYQNLSSESLRFMLIDTLKKFQHLAADELLVEFIDAGLPQLSVDAGFALAEKSDYSNNRALKGLMVFFQHKTSHRIEDVLSYIMNYNSEEAANLIIERHNIIVEGDNTSFRMGNWIGYMRYLAQMTVENAQNEVYEYYKQTIPYDRVISSAEKNILGTFLEHNQDDAINILEKIIIHILELDSNNRYRLGKVETILRQIMGFDQVKAFALIKTIFSEEKFSLQIQEHNQLQHLYDRAQK